MPTIVIIGAGGIGSRHLQSLSNIKIPLQIFVVDPILKALKIAKKMLEEEGYVSGGEPGRSREVLKNRVESLVD